MIDSHGRILRGNGRPDPAIATKINLAALRSTPLVDAVQFWVDMTKKWGLLDKGSTLKAEDLFVKF